MLIGQLTGDGGGEITANKAKVQVASVDISVHYLWHQKHIFFHLILSSHADISSPFCGDPTWLFSTGI